MAKSSKGRHHKSHTTHEPEGMHERPGYNYFAKKTPTATKTDTRRYPMPTEKSIWQDPRVKRFTQGGPVKNINFLAQVMKHPCTVDGPQIIIKTAFQAALPMLISFNQFSCLDILKSRAGISWKCGRTIKAATMQGLKPKLVKGLHTLYSLGTAQGEQALWYWFVADVGTGFVADWTSLIYQELGCDAGNHHSFRVNASGIWLDAGQTVKCFIDPSPPGECAISKANEIIVPSGCTAAISYELQLRPFRPDDPGQKCSAITYIQDEQGTQYNVGEMKWKHGDEHTNDFGFVNHLKTTFGNEKRYGVYYHITEGNCGCNVGHVTVSTTGRRVLAFPTGCKPRDVLKWLNPNNSVWD